MHLTDECAMGGDAHCNSSVNNGKEAMDLVALTRALDAGQLDVTVHWLQLLLLSKTGGNDARSSRVRQLKTLQNAVTRMLIDCEIHNEDDGLTLRPGLAGRSQGANCELSYAQLQMFALQKLQPSSTAYNVARALLFTNLALDFGALRDACAALMAKHEALRTCFDIDANAGGQPRQFVHPSSHFQGELDIVRVVQMEKLTSACSSHDTEMAASVAKSTDEPFDLSFQAPIRVYVFTSSPSSEGKATSPWIVVVVLHHIVTDAASSQLFWKDFHELYEHFLHKPVTAQDFLQQLETEASNASHLTYRDFAVWQRAQMRSGVAAPLLNYWVEELTEGGAPSLLELPFDRAPMIDDQQSTVLESIPAKGDVAVFRSSHALQKAFSELCHAQGASMFMGLLAVFYLLVERLSGQQDFVIGAPSSGRERAELQDIMGYFVNTLPLRLGLKCTGKENFRDFLTVVRKVVLDAYNHSEIPFHKVLEHLRASAHTSRDVEGEVERRWQHPLFQIMFSWEQSSDDASSNKYTELILPCHSAKFGLMLSMRYRQVNDSPTGRVLEGTMEYPTARFERSTIERFTKYYLELLEQVTTKSTAIVRSPSISMLPEFERSQFVSNWGIPKPSTTEKRSSDFLDECMVAQVRKTPNNPALHFEAVQWTYQELWDNSSRVIEALCMLDIPCNDAELHIGLLMDRGLENVAAMVGILRMKAVFVPLDPEFPRERLCYMAKDSSLHVIITQRKHEAIAAYLSSSFNDELSPRVLRYEDVDLLTSHRNTLAKDYEHFTRDSRLRKRDLRFAGSATAYILYTSGSTGNPKGVVVPHAALMTTLWWTVRTYKVTSSDVFLQSTSTTLDGSLSQLFSPLLVGGSARITRPKGLHELHYMRNVLLEAPHITYCVFVPSYFALIVDYLSDRGDLFPASIKHVILAGEAFPIELAKQFYNKHKNSKTCLVNEYGPTEASITSTAFRIPRELAFQMNSFGLQSIPIGKPIDSHPVLVLDSQRRLVPVNVPGELYIGGTGVAHGYWHRPELTEKAFIRHEDIKEIASLPNQGRWYKTGDLVKWLSTGDLVFLGRTDAQVKHHGMRVELQEVRNVLLRHGSIKAAEVLSVPQFKALGQKRRQTSSILVAFVMPNESINDQSTEEKCPETLRAYLNEHLPIHMVPQSIQVVSSWPRTPNGKIDLRALANFADSNSHNGRVNGKFNRTSKGPEITVQLATDILRQVWIQALGLNGDDDGEEEDLMSKSFFELGGDSLAAIRAIALAQARGFPLALEQFFRTSSLREMAASAASIVDLKKWTSETLIPLNWSAKASTTPTLFLFHDADGTVWKLLELARQLPFSVVGVQASGSSLLAESIEELAEFYWKVIRERQSEGPYALGGYSFGCRVAHEVARLAVNEGQKLLPLVLLDGLPFEVQQVSKDEKETARRRIEEYSIEAFSDELLQPLGRNYRKFCAMEEVYQPCTAVETTEASMWLAADLYMTQRWSADTWQYRAFGIDITTVATLQDCTHLTMLRHPTVKDIARKIRQRTQRILQVEIEGQL